MPDKPTNAGEMIGLDNFDPMTIDTSEIKELSESIPKDGNIDLNNAEVLATKYLHGFDLCVDLTAMAFIHVARTNDAKQRAYNEAFLVKSSEHKHIKTDKMRVAFAELDADYQNACEENNKAVGFYKWISSKSKSFERAHYLCKEIVKRGADVLNASGWHGKPIENDSW